MKLQKTLKMQEKIETIRSNEEIGVKLRNAWEEKIYDREDGRKEGWEMGIREGRLKGLQEGMQKGMQKGRQEGQKENQEKIIAKMKQKLSDEEIVELTGIPKEEVEAVPKD